jgi:hypothetical protein
MFGSHKMYMYVDCLKPSFEPPLIFVAIHNVPFLIEL